MHSYLLFLAILMPIVFSVVIRFLNISNVEPNFLADEVGDMLDFLIYITYFDFIKFDNETCENMQDINLDMKG